MSNQTVTLKESYTNETIRLLCREDDSLTIEIISDLIAKPSDYESQRQYNGSLYLFKLQEYNNDSPQRIIYIVSKCYL